MLGWGRHLATLAQFQNYPWMNWSRDIIFVNIFLFIIYIFFSMHTERRSKELRLLLVCLNYPEYSEWPWLISNVSAGLAQNGCFLSIEAVPQHLRKVNGYAGRSFISWKYNKIHQFSSILCTIWDIIEVDSDVKKPEYRIKSSSESLSLKNN